MTIEELAQRMADKYDLVPSAALSMSKEFQRQAARVDGLTADESDVSDDQAYCIEYMISEPDETLFDQDRDRIETAAAQVMKLVDRVRDEDGDLSWMIYSDSDLRRALRHAAEDSMSVRELAQASGLDRDAVLEILGAED
ncbi:hypothetical protein BACT_1056 [Bifidobacterium actinocoloniiforme DSM 22766]|uniref:Uncharacterized protein n=1 Tax=Bifidobacterium actinocoloniiforme DSM 22766 TaxID=1437605 RepID=A0A086Z1F4_9BIFI|nr:hypothetical protein [Bifidobacterium actinocoloniiforme]AKV55500.1 hypothetical protein AB656_03895 [Bifidobacterium actinocoloniiforme DSM 22766]KFI40354.1 hypothetical protein BACT_1056 [Bifidobacterium actinocoloniiforme DSM 22766]